MGPDDDGGGAHPHHQYHYQALLAAVQNPTQSLHPFPLPFHLPLHPAGAATGPGAPPAAAGPVPGPPPVMHNAAPQHTQPSRGFADWSATNSAFASVAAQPPAATTNAPPFHYNVSPQSYALWTHYMLNKNPVSYASYSAPHEENPHPWRHTHIHDENPHPLRHTHVPDKDTATTRQATAIAATAAWLLLGCSASDGEPCRNAGLFSPQSVAGKINATLCGEGSCGVACCGCEPNTPLVLPPIFRISEFLDPLMRNQSDTPSKCHPQLVPSYSMETTGSASSIGFDSFTTMSLGPNICAHISPMEGSISAKEAESSEDLPTVVRNSDEMDTTNSDELHHDTVTTLPESKPSRESCTTKFNSGEYQVILRKELTKSDVANVGRIVLPKKDAEASLPPLMQGDPLILQMEDMVLPITWKFKYRFWPNNKSRMYILEAAGEFVKTHGLQAGDALIIYKDSVPGKFIIRAEKAIQQTNP